MSVSTRRRTLMLATLALPFSARATVVPRSPMDMKLEQLERIAGGRLGVCAWDGQRLHGRRVEDRFPMCSTFKAILAAAVLAQSAREPGLLARRLPVTQADMVPYAPVTGPNVGKEMSVFDLCEGTLQTSDNPAANLLMKLIGGPEAVTRYARSIGDEAFRLDRWEVGDGDADLNTAIPGDPRDTTTPLAMAQSMFRLLAGSALPEQQSAQLRAWMLGNKTGDTRIRAGVGAGIKVADKTGTGQRGSTNDIGVIWLPSGRPLGLAVYYTAEEAGAASNSEIIAAATRIVMETI